MFRFRVSKYNTVCLFLQLLLLICSESYLQLFCIYFSYINLGLLMTLSLEKMKKTLLGLTGWTCVMVNICVKGLNSCCVLMYVFSACSSRIPGIDPTPYLGLTAGLHTSLWEPVCKNGKETPQVRSQASAFHPLCRNLAADGCVQFGLVSAFTQFIADKMSGRTHTLCGPGDKLCNNAKMLFSEGAGSTCDH